MVIRTYPLKPAIRIHNDRHKMQQDVNHDLLWRKLRTRTKNSIKAEKMEKSFEAEQPNPTKIEKIPKNKNV